MQGVSLTLDARRDERRRPQRHGQDDALQHDHRAEARRGSGSIRLHGREIIRLEPHQIHNAGIAYVPQGRRVWPSLSVDEHLRLVAAPRGKDAAWTLDRVYQTFPRLYERRGNGGSQLSGGEQQMLAISRALLANPKLLVMDEPTEGLAPVIVDQVAEMLLRARPRRRDGDPRDRAEYRRRDARSPTPSRSWSTAQVNRCWTPRVLAADRDLQQRLLGVGRHGEDRRRARGGAGPARAARRAEPADGLCGLARRRRGGPLIRRGAIRTDARRSPTAGTCPPPACATRRSSNARRRRKPTSAKVFRIPYAERIGRTALVAGTFDTKGAGAALSSPTA